MKYLGIVLILGVLGAGLTSNVRAQSADTLTLSEAIRMAIRQAPTLAEGEAALARAKAQYNEIESYALPQLAGNASYARIDPVVTIPFSLPGLNEVFQTQPNNNYNANFQLQQAIWSFGRYEAEDRVAQSGIKSAQDQLDSYRAQVAYQTTQIYYAILTTDEGIAVEQQQVSVLQQNLTQAQTREKQGTATSLDALNIQARISATQSTIEDMESTRRKQAAMLRRLLGLSSTTNITVARPGTSPSLPEDLLALDTLADRQRPEILAAKDAENTARLQVESARNNNDPLLSTTITGGVKNGYLPNLNQMKLNWIGSVDFHWPILDGGRTHAQVDEAEADYQAAQARTRDAELGIENDVDQALADMQASRKRLELVKVQIDEAQQAYQIAQVRYQNGVATNLDVLTAQSALEQAQLQQAELMFNFELSQYNLNKAVGTPLW